MKQKANRRVQDLFDAAIDLQSDERRALLDRECGDDRGLRARVERLLSHARQPTDRRLRSPLWAGQHEHDTVSNDALPEDTCADKVLPPALIFPRQLGAGPVGGAGQSVASLETCLEPGTRIGEYELIRELGRGGMGTVYLARDTRLGRRVAVKVLQSDRPTTTGRFIAEAQTTTRCSHENIVVIHGVDEFRGHPFMVLEYLRGQTLRELLAGGRLPPSRAVQLMIPIVRALECAHNHQIVHRDLKPDNVLVTRSGVVKVLDFGISKFVHERQHPPAPVQMTASLELTVPRQPALTRYGSLIGTLPYMAPEQWRSDKVDFRTDLWAVGIMLYRMVVGKHPLAPLRGEQLMVTAVYEQPMPSAHDASIEMPTELADIIDSCLKKCKEQRMQSASQLLAALEALLPDYQGRELANNESPYAGLTAFQESDANRFFGRSRDIAAMLARIHDQPLIGVVGPSGVGKSSFVRAGVVPALKHSGESWQAFVIRPGRQPMAALASIVTTILTDDSGESTELADEHSHPPDVVRRLYSEPGFLGTVLRSRAGMQDCKIVVFVDQFEELYTLTPDVRERLAFTTALDSVADDGQSPLRVILSIRSDFLDRVAEDRQFMSELHHGLYFLPQPDREGLSEALVRPAEMAGYHFESPWIVEHMLDSLQTTSGALPLLQFTASKLWEMRDTVQQFLTERSYRDLGGIDGALASHANAVLAGFSPQEQALVRAIFLQLVTIERTRDIASVNELRELWHDPATVQRLVDQLVDARLLVVNTGDWDTGALVEIVHESLIRSWPMLSHWLDENQEDAPYLEQLKTVAKQWQAKGRPNGLLWRGDAAVEANRWFRRYRGLLPRLHKEYLEAVFALSARTARRKRLAIGGTMAFLSILVVAAAVAIVWIRAAQQEAVSATQEAEEARRVAERAQQTAEESAEKIRRQYDELQATKEGKRRAEGEVKDREKQLEARNRDLNLALREANAANQKATRALKRSEKAAQAEREAAIAKDMAIQELRTARAKLKEAFEQERQKVRALERKLGTPLADKMKKFPPPSQRAKR